MNTLAYHIIIVLCNQIFLNRTYLNSVYQILLYLLLKNVNTTLYYNIIISLNHIYIYIYIYKYIYIYLIFDNIINDLDNIKYNLIPSR